MELKETISADGISKVEFIVHSKCRSEYLFSNGNKGFEGI